MPNLSRGKKRPWIKPRPRMKHSVDNSAFYNSRVWRRTRLYYIQNNPLCEECERNNIVEAATCVDHILPIRLNGSKLSLENLQSLCTHCHAVKSGKEAHL